MAARSRVRAGAKSICLWARATRASELANRARRSRRALSTRPNRLPGAKTGVSSSHETRGSGSSLTPCLASSSRSRRERMRNAGASGPAADVETTSTGPDLAIREQTSIETVDVAEEAVDREPRPHVPGPPRAQPSGEPPAEQHGAQPPGDG